MKVLLCSCQCEIYVLNFFFFFPFLLFRTDFRCRCLDIYISYSCIFSSMLSRIMLRTKIILTYTSFYITVHPPLIIMLVPASLDNVFWIRLLYLKWFCQVSFGFGRMNVVALH